MVAHDGALTGVVWANGDQYRLQPAGGRVHALIRVNGSVSADDDTPARTGSPPPEGTPSITRLTPDGTQTLLINVLVAYSNGAKRSTPDIVASISLATEAANQAYRNSNIGVELNLVDTFQIPYDESGQDGRQILDDFTVNPVVQTRRQVERADIAVLFVAMPNVPSKQCGRAYTVMANSSAEAFAFVDYECAVSNYTLAHEIGHLMGARRDNDPKNTPFPYGHAFKYAPNGGGEGWVTIMASGGRGLRIPYLSNPSMMYGGVVMGTAQQNDNVRVLNRTAAYMTTLRTTDLVGFLPCAAEGDMCSFSGLRTVAFGTTATRAFAFRLAADGVPCNDNLFGDPQRNSKKQCYVSIASYAMCADESRAMGACRFSGDRTVAFGVDDRFVFARKIGGSECNTDVFGDPYDGVRKACYVGIVGFTYCAPENRACFFVNGQRLVAYGANGIFVYKVLKGGLRCTNTAFGVDPTPDVAKACYLSEVPAP